MRVDFVQLSRDPVERVVATFARNLLETGDRLLVVSDDETQLERIGEALWERYPDRFLANGKAGEPHAARQPILLSQTPEAENTAKTALFADGKWRDEASGFERVLLMFDSAATDAARDLWRGFDGQEDLERHIFKQNEDGSWREGR